MNLTIPEGKILIQFDGMCILCSRTIRFILKADRRRRFVFQALQNSADGEAFDTVIVSDGISIYSYFEAFMKIGKELGGIYRMIVLLRIIPRRWQKSLYLWIAKNRYRWFGVRKSCYLSSEEEKESFI
jgi:predicted DCC family thiol-disulfide oxidoreductase YuxK